MWKLIRVGLPMHRIREVLPMSRLVHGHRGPTIVADTSRGALDARALGPHTGDGPDARLLTGTGVVDPLCGLMPIVVLNGLRLVGHAHEVTQVRRVRGSCVIGRRVHRVCICRVVLHGLVSHAGVVRGV